MLTEYWRRPKNEHDRRIPYRRATPSGLGCAQRPGYPEALHSRLDGYRDVFDPETLPATAESFLRLMTKKYRGPHWVTRYGLKGSFDQSQDPTFFVFDPTDGQDVIDFWDYRIFKSDVLPVNLHEKLFHGFLLPVMRPPIASGEAKCLAYMGPKPLISLYFLYAPAEPYDPTNVRFGSILLIKSLVMGLEA